MIWLDDARLRKAEAIFRDLVELCPQDRSAAMLERCGSDVELRALVERLIACDTGGGDPLDSRIRFRPFVDGRLGPALPFRIGHYQVIREIGQGGMGVVYEAQQEHPHRAIALKVLRYALPSEDVLRRFQMEAEVLGRLNHPGIAHVYDAGVGEVRTPGGERMRLPFVAMELVRGQPLVEFAESHKLSVRHKLELMAHVCEAVNHAHQHGVIHRDLKPANILVVDEEGSEFRVQGSGQKDGGQSEIGSRKSAIPKILDFGIARVTRADFQNSTAHTGVGQIVGTLAYMSPEQVRGDPTQIDTRTDVYSLGLILYELLSGRLPYDLADLAIPEAMQALCEREPARLSSLDRSLQGELETIVAKAIAKDKARRYQSAAALGEDLRRYLRGEIIEARRDSAFYVLGKNLRRYRWPVAVLIGLMLSLALFGLYAAAQSQRYARLAVEEHEARVAAQRAQSAAAAAEHEAVAGRERATRETTRAESVTDFLLEMLSMTDPDVTQMRDMSVQKLLDSAADEIDAALSTQPQTEAAVRTAIGRAYASLGVLEDAEQQLARALQILDTQDGAEPQAVYKTLWPYAYVLNELGDVTWPEHWRRLRGMPAALLEQTHAPLAEAARAMCQCCEREFDAARSRLLVAEFVGQAESALALDDSAWLLIADALYIHGRDVSTRRQDADAADCLGQALAIQRRLLPPTHSRVFETLGILISAKIRATQYQEAESVARETIEVLRGVLPVDHWMVAEFEQRLGMCLVGQQRHAEAEVLLQRGLQRVIAAYGWTHRSVATALRYLITTYEALGRPADATEQRRLLAGALARLHQSSSLFSAGIAFGPEHAPLWTAMRGLRIALIAGSPEAPELLEQVLALRRSSLADDHELSALFVDVMSPWLDAYIHKRGFDEQVSLRGFQELLTMARSNPHLHPHKRAAASFWVAAALEALGDYQTGEPLAREAVLLAGDSRRKTPSRGGNVSSLLGGHLMGLGRYEEAELWLVEGYELLLRSLGSSHSATWGAWTRLVTLYARWGANSERLIPRLQHIMDSNPPAGVLDVWGWNVLVFPNMAMSVYEVALQALCRANELTPGDVQILKTLGMAHYRLGHFETALVCMRQADELRRAQWFPEGIPEDVAFITLSLQQLGRTEEARESFNRMCTLLSDDRPDHPIAKQLKIEVEHVLQMTCISAALPGTDP
ncbi:MAG TPA: protein kinase [Phycisphaerae bacterium]